MLLDWTDVVNIVREPEGYACSAKETKVSPKAQGMAGKVEVM